MTIVYKTLNENEPQYLADKLSIKTVDKTTRYNILLSKVVLASAQFALDFFKCLGVLHFISLYVH